MQNTAFSNQKIQLIQYNELNFQKFDDLIVGEISEKVNFEMVNWINFECKPNQDILEELLDILKVHPLVAEDLVNGDEIPKLELYDDHIFCMIKMMHFSDRRELVFENVSFVVFDNLIFTFQNSVDGDVFKDVRNRISSNLGKIRKRKVDYLFWRLIDSITQKYTIVLEYYRTEIELLEENLIQNPNEIQTNRIIQIKRQLNYIRKYIIPLKEELNIIKQESFKFINKSTLVYFKDTYDHLIHLEASFESYRDMLRDVLDIQNANQSQNMNLIMKTLTIVSSIFIPLTFIAGIYGMNFEFMPELHKKWAYPLLWIFMILLTLGMLYFFRKRKWL